MELTRTDTLKILMHSNLVIRTIRISKEGEAFLKKYDQMKRLKLKKLKGGNN